MMIVVTQENDKPAAINTEKILWVKGTLRWGRVESTIFCEGCNPLEVKESPEDIAEMCNQNQY